MASNRVNIPLSSLSLPQAIQKYYLKIGITSLFEWQVDCLKVGRVKCVLFYLFPFHFIWYLHLSGIQKLRTGKTINNTQSSKYMHYLLYKIT